MRLALEGAICFFIPAMLLLALQMLMVVEIEAREPALWPVQIGLWRSVSVPLGWLAMTIWLAIGTSLWLLVGIVFSKRVRRTNASMPFLFLSAAAGWLFVYVAY